MSENDAMKTNDSIAKNSNRTLHWRSQNQVNAEPKRYFKPETDVPVVTTAVLSVVLVGLIIRS